MRAIVIPPAPSLFRLQEILAQQETDMDALDQLPRPDVALAAALIRTRQQPAAPSRATVTVGMALTVLACALRPSCWAAFITRQALQVRSPLLEHFCAHSAAPLPASTSAASSTACPMGYKATGCSAMWASQAVKAVRGYASTVTEALARKDRSFTPDRKRQPPHRPCRGGRHRGAYLAPAR